MALVRSEAYINGRWASAASGETFEVRNPANGEHISHVASLGTADTHIAIEAAKAALGSWSALTGKERGAILERWFDLVMKNQEALAEILSAEQGKPMTESRGEIAYGASFLKWFAEEAKRTYGEVIPSDRADRRLLVVRQPVGVVAAITPWNFPIAMITRKVGPALAAGCTIIVKPASETPLSALALAAMAGEAGVPPGVLNVVTGDPVVVGGALTSHPTVRKLSFTGSTAVGKLLTAQCAATMKRVSMELGGNAPFIVFDDADIDLAVDGLIASKFRNGGQTCVCTNRVLVQRGIRDRFVGKLVSEVSKLRVAPASDPLAQQGPLISQKAVNKVQSHVDDALAKGAKVAIGGAPHALGGTFYQPTVLTGVKRGMAILVEETFGPVAAVVDFETEDEAIGLANETEFGLAAYVFTRDLGRSWRVSEALECGMVGVNEGIISTEVAPFGGVKESGVGREGSRHGIDDYLEMKYICMGIR